MTNHPDAWTSDQAYEPYVGRWSRLVAPRFLRWLPPLPPSLSYSLPPALRRCYRTQLRSTGGPVTLRATVPTRVRERLAVWTAAGLELRLVKGKEPGR